MNGNEAQFSERGRKWPINVTGGSFLSGKPRIDSTFPFISAMPAPFRGITPRECAQHHTTPAPRHHPQRVCPPPLTSFVRRDNSS